MISGKAEHEALKDRCVNRIYGMSRPFILSDADRAAIVGAVLAEVRRTLETVSDDMALASRIPVFHARVVWLAMLHASPLGEVLAEIKPREGSAS